MVVKQCIELKIKPYFHQDFYGYRPNKSASSAIEVTRGRCWKSDYVLEFDMVGLFDNINYELLLRTVEKHTSSLLKMKMRPYLEKNSFGKVNRGDLLYTVNECGAGDQWYAFL